jgi:O-antigen ligase
MMGAGMLLALITTLASPIISLLLSVVIVSALLLFRRPVLMILAVLAIVSGILDYDRLPLLSLGPISLHVTDILLGILLFLAIIWRLILTSSSPVTTPLDALVLAFYIGILISCYTSIVIYGVSPSWVIKLVRPLSYYLIFFAVTNLIRERRQLDLLIGGMFAIAVCASAGVIVQAFIPQIHLIKTTTMVLQTAQRGYEGVSRTFTPADRLIYVMLVTSTALLVLRPFRRRSMWVELGRIGLLGGALILTFQRNYWVTMGVALELLYLAAPTLAKVRLAAVAGGTLVVVLCIVWFGGSRLQGYAFAAVERIGYGLRPETLSVDSSTQMRVNESEYGLASIAEHPILGIGLGNIYRPYNADDSFNMPENPLLGLRWFMHNAYMWVLVISGIIGFVPFIGLYLVFVARGLSRWRAIRDVKLRGVCLGFTMAMIGQMITNLVAPNFVQSWSLAVFATMMGVNEVIYRLDAQAYTGSPRESQTRALAGGAFGVLQVSPHGNPRASRWLFAPSQDRRGS